jgi:hypothetical protein
LDKQETGGNFGISWRNHKWSMAGTAPMANWLCTIIKPISVVLLSWNDFF